MDSPMISAHLPLGDLERSNSRPLRFPPHLSCNGAELSHMLQLNINRKASMGNPNILSHLILSDLER